MDQHPLGQRGRTLEEEFFRKEEAKLLEKLRAQERQKVTREELGRAIGVADPAALDRLTGLGLSPATLSALSLVPLVEVAWASGDVDADERKAVVESAKAAGVDPAGLELLASWLTHAPDRALIDAWRTYVGTVAGALTPDQRAKMKAEVLGRARKVAAASGGVLGVGKVSKAEEQKLQELGGAFP